jgi:protein phosphatase
VSHSALRWTSCCISDVGKVRRINEDACLDHPQAGVWVVADGMGGHAAGDLASQMIVDSLQAVGSADRLSTLVDAVDDRLEQVNLELRRLSRERRDRQTIGSTVVALLVHERICVCLWAGDSRVYRLRGGALTQLTRDHNQVAELVDQGLLTAEEAEAHPASNVITRAIGAADALYLDAKEYAVESDDVYLLCSDGLYKEVAPAEMRATLEGGDDCGELARALVDLALSRGARDNVTVLVAKAVAG